LGKLPQIWFAWQKSFWSELLWKPEIAVDRSFMDLPSLRTILTRLLKDLETEKEPEDNDASGQTEQSAGIVSLTVTSLPQQVENSLLALHQIFPQLLLASLDLLDNLLVTRYLLPHTSNNSNHTSPPVYYVRSSQSRTSRTQHVRAVYEVRTSAWHCTCPSFTFSAFSSRNSIDPYEHGEDDNPGSERWGGEMRGGQLGICKHLMAVIIGERLRLIPEKEVDMHTLAVYAYGDA
jgi:hypothetical protein